MTGKDLFNCLTRGCNGPRHACFAHAIAAGEPQGR
jgi:hypothetical protein